jgi:hypothetical protein
MWNFFSSNSLLFSSVSFQRCSTLLFVLKPLPLGGERDEDWKISKKQCSFGYWGALEGVVLSINIKFHKLILSVERTSEGDMTVPVQIPYKIGS